MSNPFYGALGGGGGQNNSQNLQQNPMQMLQQLKSNPVGFLKNMGYNIPDNLSGNPLGIMQHLASSGQLNQQQMAQFSRMQRPGRR